jgi:hypothetical protein
MSELSKFLNGLKKSFLTEQGTTGGVRRGFREYVGKRYETDPDYFTKLALDACMQAANFVWQAQPRKRGPDLFSVAGYAVPEYLTRPVSGYIPVGEDDDEHGDTFEKVDASFATVQDLIDDAMLHMRKAAQSSAAAERQMKAADVARRRAGNNLAAFIRDIADLAVPDAAE